MKLSSGAGICACGKSIQISGELLDSSTGGSVPII